MFYAISYKDITSLVTMLPPEFKGHNVYSYKLTKYLVIQGIITEKYESNGDVKNCNIKKKKYQSDIGRKKNAIQSFVFFFSKIKQNFLILPSTIKTNYYLFQFTTETT